MAIKQVRMIGSVHKGVGEQSELVFASLKPLSWFIRRISVMSASVVLGCATWTGLVIAGPEDGQIIGGDGSISVPSDSTTLIQQQSDRLAIDWDSFNIASQESVHFQQPSTSAIALNRILDQNPSQIMGSIQANGRVFVINPNGLVFGQSAQVNVGSFVASTLDIDSSDFMNGSYQFSSDGRHEGGVVINRGLIQAASGGSVNLIGGAIINEGHIVADYGHVNLGVGRRAVLDFDGDGLIRFEVDEEVLQNVAGLEAAINNAGQIVADGGEVLLTAQAAQDVFSRVVNNDGIIKATRIENIGGVVRLVGEGGATIHSGDIHVSGQGEGSTGGTVHVLGDQVGLVGSATISASGDAGGGEVLIGGGYQGANPEIQNAQRTYVSSDTSINANANINGDGGTVIVWADDATFYYGDINARGGQDSGNGGFAEISGKRYLDKRGSVDLTALQGETGSLLLDPANIEITGGSADGADDTNAAIDELIHDAGSNVAGSILFADEGDGTPDPFIVYESEIEAQSLTANILLEARNSISVTGTFDNDADGVGADDPGTDVVLIQGGNSLTLRTRNDAADGIGGIDLTGVVGLEFATTGGSILIESGSDGVGGGGGEAGEAPVTVGALTAGSGGSIQVVAEGSLTVAGDVTTTGGGTIDLIGLGVTVNDNVRVSTATGQLTIDAGTGSLTLDDSGGSASTLVTTDAAISITADDVDIGTQQGANDDQIVAGSGNDITIANTSANQTIGLGGGAGALNLGDDEIGQLNSTGLITIGSSSAGAIIVDTADFSTAGDATTDLSLLTGANINDVNDSTTHLSADLLTLIADNGSGSSAVSPLNVAVNNLNTTSSSGSVFISNEGSLVINGINTGTGDLDVSAGGDLTDSGLVTVGGNASFSTSVTNDDIVLDNLAVTGAIDVATSGPTGNVTLVNATAVDLATSVVGGGLDVTATSGNITDSGLVTVLGDASFTSSGANDDILLDDLYVVGAVGVTTDGSSGNATLVNATGLNLAASSVEGDLSVTAVSGNIADSGTVAVDGDTSLTVGNGASITLDSAANNFGGAVSFNSVGTIANITFVDNSAFELAALSLSGDLDVTTGGDLIDSGLVSVAGGASFTTTTANDDILLDNLAVTGAISVTTSDPTANATLVNATAVDLAAANVGGDLTVTATTGNITDSGTITVDGMANFTTSTADADIVLDNFTATGSVGVTTYGANGNATLVSSDAMEITTSDVEGDLNATASGGNLTDSGLVTVNGNASFTTSASGAEIVLDSLAVIGAIDISTNGSNANATLVNSTAVSLAASSVGGDLSVTAGSGGLIDSGLITVGGDASFTTSAADEDIVVDNLAVSGSIGVNTNGTSGNATIIHATALGLGASNVNGNLNAIASSGNITDSGAVVVTGNTSLTVAHGASIILDDDSNSFGGALAFNSAGTIANITLADITAVEVPSIDISGNLQITSATEITDAAGTALSVAGLAAFDAGAGVITLGDDVSDNTNFGSLSVTGGVVSINEDSATDLAGADVASLALTSDGAITDSGNTVISVTGLAAFDAGANDIELGSDTGDSTNFGSLTLAGMGVSVSEDSDTELVSVNTASLTMTSGGAIEDSPSANIDITGLATFNSGINTITLGNDVGDSINFGSLAVVGGAVTISEESATDIAEVNASSLVLTSSEEINDQTGSSINVTGLASFNAGSHSITLGEETGNITNFGSLALSGGTVLIFEDSATNFSNVSVASLELSSAGNITQTAPMIVSAETKLVAVGDIDLSNKSNDLSTINFTFDQEGTLYESNTIQLSQSSVTGSHSNFDLSIDEATYTTSATPFVCWVSGNCYIEVRSDSSVSPTIYISSPLTANVDVRGASTVLTGLLAVELVGESQIAALEDVTFVDWSLFSAELSLFGTVEPGMMLPEDQLEEEFEEAFEDEGPFVFNGAKKGSSEIMRPHEGRKLRDGFLVEFLSQIRRKNIHSSVDYGSL